MKILDFSNNPLGDAGMTGLSSAFVPEEFDEDDYTCALEELYLSKCGIQVSFGVVIVAYFAYFAFRF